MPTLPGGSGEGKGREGKEEEEEEGRERALKKRPRRDEHLQLGYLGLSAQCVL